LSQNVGGWAAAASLAVLAILQSYFLVQQWQMVLMSRVTNIARARKPTIVNAHLEKPVGERWWFMYQNRQSNTTADQ